MFKHIEKKNQILFLLASVFLYTFTSYIWMNCVKYACTESLIDNYLGTFQMAGLVGIILGCFFVFLPSTYFNVWFMYIFSWALPLSIILVNTLHSETGWLVISKTDVVRLMGIVFGVVTLVFVVCKWFLSRK